MGSGALFRAHEFSGAHWIDAARGSHL